MCNSFFLINVGYSQLGEAKPESLVMSSERLERITKPSKVYINNFNIPGILSITKRKNRIL